MAAVSVVRPLPPIARPRCDEITGNNECADDEKRRGKDPGRGQSLREKAGGRAEQGQQDEGPQARDVAGLLLLGLALLALDADKRAEQDGDGEIAGPRAAPADSSPLSFSTSQLSPLYLPLAGRSDAAEGCVGVGGLARCLPPHPARPMAGHPPRQGEGLESVLGRGAFAVLGVERHETVAGGGRDAALGDEAADEPRRRHVEAEIGGRASLGRDQNARDRAVGQLARTCA